MICLKNLSGTCETSSECSTDGGSADGTCAAGFGVCCVFFFFSFVVIALCLNWFTLVTKVSFSCFCFLINLYILHVGGSPATRFDCQQHLQHQHQHQQHLREEPGVGFRTSVNCTTREPKRTTDAPPGTQAPTLRPTPGAASSPSAKPAPTSVSSGLTLRWLLFFMGLKKSFFQTFTGFATTTPVGSCSDSLAVAGLKKSTPWLSQPGSWLWQSDCRNISISRIQARQAPTPRQSVGLTRAITVRSQWCDNHPLNHSLWISLSKIICIHSYTQGRIWFLMSLFWELLVWFFSIKYLSALSLFHSF